MTHLIEQTDDYRDGVRDAQRCMVAGQAIRPKTYDPLFDGEFRRRYVAGWNSVTACAAN